ncbi:conserved hypothetical protein [Neospora caninum Liverpool]|uniref:Radial spoke head protein 9 homolog n=1 Tax=Neospora caninum (strain Liverpool) TaxID=572307 RepID=F0VH91_NEOCL|nr:conserved hypothetical protein [Neospora caninum Liverpool]CBZ53085.1 conserved hypothetical protein [Neospora caninum Liverpool]|eukprot:XP_003883117.1 conserved hypothetical protein [Neospora caninum Liverpool]
MLMYSERLSTVEVGGTFRALFGSTVFMMMTGYLHVISGLPIEPVFAIRLWFGHSRAGTVAAETDNKEDDESDTDNHSTNHRGALNEVHALSHLIYRIDDATAAVPRGAFRLKYGNKIAPSPEFTGLSFGEAQKFSSWVHFRPAKNLETLQALASKDYQVRYSTWLCSKPQAIRKTTSTTVAHSCRVTTSGLLLRILLFQTRGPILCRKASSDSYLWSVAQPTPV